MSSPKGGEQPSTSPSLQTHPCSQRLSPSGDEVTIFDLRTFEPHVGTSFHHGSLYHTHEPSMDLTHLNRARRHKLQEQGTHESRGSAQFQSQTEIHLPTPTLQRLKGKVPGADLKDRYSKPQVLSQLGKHSALPATAKPRTLLAKLCPQTPGALSSRLSLNKRHAQQSPVMQGEAVLHAQRTLASTSCPVRCLLLSPCRPGQAEPVPYHCIVAITGQDDHINGGGVIGHTDASISGSVFSRCTTKAEVKEKERSMRRA